ncbi:PH domain-containing protein [Sphingomonas sp. LHG3443-2]|uniref:PH domain-containing protein n=1 Tax=Sphingomonas sp. LHG3443-2 TaxID=2804639 RepID=UPI003CE9F37C
MTVGVIESGNEAIAVETSPPPSELAAVQRVERSYMQVIRVRTLLAWLPLVIGAVVLDRLVLAKTPVGGLLMVLVPLVAILATAMAPPRIWARLGYALEPAMLRVVRGWMFHTDTLVPLVRVQHLDVARGPLDKMFGTATLAIHTAGTHNSIVRLPGLSADRAAELAAVIRTHIRADLD